MNTASHDIVLVKLRVVGETKPFIAHGMKFNSGDKVIVEADRGLDYGEVVNQERGETPSAAIITLDTPVTQAETPAVLSEPAITEPEKAAQPAEPLAGTPVEVSVEPEIKTEIKQEVPPKEKTEQPPAQPPQPSSHPQHQGEPLRKIIRKANPWDEEQIAKNRAKTPELMNVCNGKIKEHNLPMKLVDAEYSFDRSKIIFYFTAENRVDFRNLVKDLAGVFRVRIELRQIGVRDEAKMLGGLGPCGRKLCCISFLKDFNPVTIKMAKVQNLPLNPAKISGLCGRLMCCLEYEYKCYEECSRGLPKVGKEIQTEYGKGKVIEVNPLERLVTVDLGEGKIRKIKFEHEKK